MGYVESLLARNETIVFKTRQHWIVLARSFLLNSMFLVLIIILASVASVMLGPAALLAALLLVVPVLVFGLDYLRWWDEEYIITNRRVIQVEGIINKHVIDSSLEKVNDVVLKQSFLGRLLDYGDIDILTASEMGINALYKLHSPIKFKTEMLNQKESFGSEDRAGVPGGDQDIPTLIAELDHLRKQGILTEAEFQDKKAQLLAKLQ